MLISATKLPTSFYLSIVALRAYFETQRSEKVEQEEGKYFLFREGIKYEQRNKNVSNLMVDIQSDKFAPWNRTVNGVGVDFAFKVSRVKLQGDWG
jgi:Mg2+ and Co2+ transporter CorA